MKRQKVIEGINVPCRDHSLIPQNIRMIQDRIDNNLNMGPREKLAGKVMINTLRLTLDYKLKKVKTPKQVMREINRLEYEKGYAL